MNSLQVKFAIPIGQSSSVFIWLATFTNPQKWCTQVVFEVLDFVNFNPNVSFDKYFWKSRERKVDVDWTCRICWKVLTTSLFKSFTGWHFENRILFGFRNLPEFRDAKTHKEKPVNRFQIIKTYSTKPVHLINKHLLLTFTYRDVIFVLDLWSKSRIDSTDKSEVLNIDQKRINPRHAQRTSDGWSSVRKMYISLTTQTPHNVRIRFSNK